MHFNAHEMNAKPGGKQPLMHDSVQWKATANEKRVRALSMDSKGIDLGAH